MSLATRCTSCGTVFRVVQDQLKVSEGWVRCGRCNEVFNALEGLFDLERETPPPWPAIAAADEPAAPAAMDEVFAADASDPELVDRIDAAVFRASADEAEAKLADAESTAAADTRQAFRSLPPPPRDAAAHIATWDVDRPSAPPAEPGAEPAATPEFMRRAERAARWQSRGARLGLGLASAALALLLLGQAAYHFRDALAARWPASRPMLAEVCARFACSIEAPRHIDEISVESTALTRAPGPDAFRLAVTLRNRGKLALQMPSVDLSLTDTAGQLVARKALAPRDFRVTSPMMAPGTESALQLQLSAGSPRVTGYTVEIFYP